MIFNFDPVAISFLGKYLKKVKIYGNLTPIQLESIEEYKINKFRYILDISRDGYEIIDGCSL